MLQQLALLQGLQPRRHGRGRAGVHPSAGGMRQARLCRPREVLRRSGVRERAVRDAALGSIQRRTPQAVANKASMELRPGSVEGFGAHRSGARRAPRAAVGSLGAGEPTVGRMGEVVGDTVHFDIVDQAGNMVSSTPSGGWLQSSPVIPELGFCLGTRAQMFWLDEDHPASLEPGQAAAHDAVADARAARRRSLSRLGLARRRSAGPVDHAVLPAPRARGNEPAGSDRRAGLALRAFSDLVLAAHLAAGRAGDGDPACRKRR